MRSRFGRDVVALGTGTAASQLIALATLPLLARLYSPGDFGGGAVYSSIIGLALVVASLRYELAIPLPQPNRAAIQVVGVATVSLGLTSLLLVIGYRPALELWDQNTGLDDDLFFGLLLAGFIAGGLYNIANYWGVRNGDFRSISTTRVQQSLIGASAQIALGVAGVGVMGLILGQILALGAGTWRLSSNLLRRRGPANASLSLRGITWAMKRYRRFPLYDAAAALLNSGGHHLPPILFASLFSPILAGYYALAVRLVSAPITLVGRSISQVLLPGIIHAGRRGEAPVLVIKVLGMLAWCGFLPFTVIALTATDIVQLLFGSKWIPAGNVVAWTSIWAAWQFVVSPLSTAMVALEAQRLQTAVQFLLFAVRIIAILTGAFFSSFEIALIAFSSASCVCYAIYLLAIGLTVAAKPRDIWRSIALPLLLAGACAGAALAASYVSELCKYSVLFVSLGWWAWYLFRGFQTDRWNLAPTPGTEA